VADPTNVPAVNVVRTDVWITHCFFYSTSPNILHINQSTTGSLYYGHLGIERCPDYRDQLTEDDLQWNLSINDTLVSLKERCLLRELPLYLGLKFGVLIGGDFDQFQLHTRLHSRLMQPWILHLEPTESMMVHSIWSRWNISPMHDPDCIGIFNPAELSVISTLHIHSVL
jgi:hypothetical protein